MASDSQVLVALKLVGAAAFGAEAKGASKELAGIGKSGDQARTGLVRAGAAATIAEGRLGRAHLNAKRLGTSLEGLGKTSLVGRLKSIGSGLTNVGGPAAAAGVALVAVAAAAELVKTSFEKTKTLAESAAVLSNVAGLSGTAGIQLAAVASATGVQSRQLGMSLKALSTQATSAADGSKAAAKTFGLLHISLKDVKGTGGDVTKLLALVAAGMDRTKGGAAKLAATSKLLGRGWMGLNPLLEGGGKELRSLTAYAGKLGITLSGNTSANLAKARDLSYRWKLTMMAVQLFITNKLIPVLIDVGTFAVNAAGRIVGAFGKVKKATVGIWDGLKSDLVAGDQLDRRAMEQPSVRRRRPQRSRAAHRGTPRVHANRPERWAGRDEAQTRSEGCLTPRDEPGASDDLAARHKPGALNQPAGHHESARRRARGDRRAALRERDPETR